MVRIIILSKIIKSECKNMLNPRMVNQVKVNGKTVPTATLNGVVVCFAVYIMVLIGSVLLISMQNLDFTTMLTAVITCIGNVGPGLGKIVGPVGNFSTIPEFSKMVLCADMLFGRLEYFPIIMLFYPKLWRRKFL